MTTLLDRLDTAEERDWYATRAVQDGWSGAVLECQIRSGLRACGWRIAWPRICGRCPWTSPLVQG